MQSNVLLVVVEYCQDYLYTTLGLDCCQRRTNQPINQSINYAYAVMQQYLLLSSVQCTSRKVHDLVRRNDGYASAVYCRLPASRACYARQLCTMPWRMSRRARCRRKVLGPTPKNSTSEHALLYHMVYVIKALKWWLVYYHPCTVFVGVFHHAVTVKPSEQST